MADQNTTNSTEPVMLFDAPSAESNAEMENQTLPQQDLPTRFEKLNVDPGNGSMDDRQNSHGQDGSMDSTPDIILLDKTNNFTSKRRIQSMVDSEQPKAEQHLAKKVKIEPGERAIMDDETDANAVNEPAEMGAKPPVNSIACSRNMRTRRSSTMQETPKQKAAPRRKKVKLEPVELPEEPEEIFDDSLTGVECNKCKIRSREYFKCLQCARKLLCKECHEENSDGYHAHSIAHPVQRLFIEWDVENDYHVKLPDCTCPHCALVFPNSRELVKHVVEGHKTYISKVVQCPLCLELKKFERRVNKPNPCSNFVDHIRQAHKGLYSNHPICSFNSLRDIPVGSLVRWNDCRAKIEAEQTRRDMHEVRDIVADDVPNPSLSKFVSLSAAEVKVVQQGYRQPYGPPPLRWLLKSDVSGGLENRPIPVFCDDLVSLSLPDDFTYMSENVISASLAQRVLKMAPPKKKGARRKRASRVKDSKICCSCESAEYCRTEKCDCYALANRPKGTFEHILNREFTDTCRSDKFEESAVFGCGPLCACKGNCANRLREDYKRDLMLEVFHRHEDSHGFGVRTLVAIPKGKIIAEFSGEVIDSVELGQRDQRSNEYCYEIFTPGEVNRPSTAETISRYIGKHNMPRSRLLIDPSKAGNIGRFFSHGCRPNLHIRRYMENSLLFEQCRLVLVATAVIPAGAELFITYGNEYLKSHQIKCTCFTPFCDSFRVPKPIQVKLAKCEKGDYRLVRKFWEFFDQLVEQKVFRECNLFDRVLNDLKNELNGGPLNLLTSDIPDSKLEVIFNAFERQHGDIWPSVKGISHDGDYGNYIKLFDRPRRMMPVPNYEYVDRYLVQKDEPSD